MKPHAYIGLMSGTSMDGIDAVLVSFSEGRAKVHATHTVGYPDPVRHQLTKLSQNQGTPDELGAMDHQVGELFSQAALGVINSAAAREVDIVAIGSHGQTVRHQPRDKHAFSMQLGDPNLIAENTGITTVADFRRRDMAAGGEGAPLVPAFHQAMFGCPSKNLCIVNIGGIANISCLLSTPEEKIYGFDTGPGNALMDAWCQDQTGKSYDENGNWANEGRVHQGLLGDMLSDAYFALPAPKSTGKEKFNLGWIKTFIKRHPDATGSDIQRTLLELTVISIAKQLPQSNDLKVYICGGGSRNRLLMQELRRVCSPFAVSSTTEIGLDPQWVEAAAFAWLAQRTLNKQPGNLPAVTGARGKRILGAVYWP
ncbi:anhydro-N-acetylmuramic acid kinase [Marinobacter zhejiangensis]|uniref:Anhydro-N-acetylmuramic acid kinase n=1 Tax=Marinobacter zhejiangensis TaxID=488535 RepID=A0A1I4MJZ3_9GAMM|nr:anhydro-N-acetylmuramic acid kinase [Marinobacter zhejiangensis]SFM03347.1 anhydro-N-acetylmuramic acid kinase [Marinobacter zhejiangensis]